MESIAPRQLQGGLHAGGLASSAAAHLPVPLSSQGGHYEQFDDISV